MVAVAQLVESRIVIPVVVGSSPISHPKNKGLQRCKPFSRQDQQTFHLVSASWLVIFILLKLHKYKENENPGQRTANNQQIWINQLKYHCAYQDKHL
jgi:hypothetical protein